MELINRNTTQALRVASITINGISLGAPTVYTLSQQTLPNTGSAVLPGGGTFSANGSVATINNCVFPKASAQVFRFPITRDNEGFESAQGYAAGADVTTQPTGRAGIDWVGSTGFFKVQAGVGTGGSNAIGSPANWSAVDSSVSLELTPPALGVAATTVSAARWSFALQTNYTPSSGTSNFWLIRPGRDATGSKIGEPTRFWLRADGTMTYQDGNTAVTVKTATGSNFVFAKGHRFNVSGTYDYAGKTYTLIVDNVPQKNEAGNSTTINWYQTAADEYGEFVVQSVGTSSAGNYGPISLDNISLSVTP